MIKYGLRPSFFVIVSLLLLNTECDKPKQFRDKHELLDYVLPDAEEAENFVTQKHFSYTTGIDWKDLVTFGLYRESKNMLLRLVTNYTPLIVSGNELDEYATLQRSRLFLKLKEFERIFDDNKEESSLSKDKKIMKTFNEQKKRLLYEGFDILQEIALDFAVFGGHHKITQENFYILEKYLKMMVQNLIKNVPIESSERSTSLRIRTSILLYSLNFRFNGAFSKLLLHILMPEMSIFTTPSHINNLRYKFSEKSFLFFKDNYDSMIKIMKQLKEEDELEKLKISLQKRISTLDEKMKEIDEKMKEKNNNPSNRNPMDAIKKMQHTMQKMELEKKIQNEPQLKIEAEANKRYLKIAERLFKEGLSLPVKNTYGLGWLANFGGKTAEIIGWPIRNDKPDEINDSEKFFKKHFANELSQSLQDDEDNSQEIALIEKLLNTPKLAKIRKRRNQMVFEEAKYEAINKRQLDILNFLTPSLKKFFTDRLEEKVIRMTSSFFLDITRKTAEAENTMYPFEFPEELLIDELNNKKLEMFFHLNIKNIKEKKIIFPIIFDVNDEEQTTHIKHIFTYIFGQLDIVFYKKKIFNPIFLSNFYIKLATNTKGRKSKVNMSQITDSIVHQNIKNLKDLMELYFIGEKYHYLPFSSQVLVKAAQNVSEIEKNTLNLHNIARKKKIITLLEVSGFEYLCRKVDMHFSSAYALLSLIFIDLVNLDLVFHYPHDVILLVFTERMDMINKAVASRIAFQVSFRKVNNRETYLILVRRLLLDLMKRKKIIFGSLTFEEALFNLVGTIYMEDYEVEEIIRIFNKILLNKNFDIEIVEIVNMFKKQVKGISEE